MEFNIKFDEQMMGEVANRVLDEFEYNGKTIREWADALAHPKTNADRIRAMTDEELAEFLLNRDLGVVEKASKAVGFTYKVDREPCLVNVIDWLKQEAGD